MAHEINVTLLFLHSLIKLDDRIFFLSLVPTNLANSKNSVKLSAVPPPAELIEIDPMLHLAREFSVNLAVGEPLEKWTSKKESK